MSRREGVKPIKFTTTYEDDRGHFFEARVKLFNRSIDSDGNQYATMEINPIRWGKSVPKNARKLELSGFGNFFEGHFRTRCNHDYDCCGCWHDRLYFIKNKGKRRVLRLYSFRNY